MTHKEDSGQIKLKCASSTLLQELPAFSPSSPALYSAQWWFTSLIKSWPVSSEFLFIIPPSEQQDTSCRNSSGWLCSGVSSSEALPFFLLLIDLSKACALAKYALSSSCQVSTIMHLWQHCNTVANIPCRIPVWFDCNFFRTKWGTT